MKVVFGRRVEPETERSADWYEEQRVGLRAAFLSEVDETVGRIGHNPRLYPEIYLDVRKAPVRRFPFGVYFLIRSEDVLILAVVHNARHPSVWQRRRR